jgi:hypothetical protein
MTDKVLLVSPPDDVLEDGVRILLVDLTSDQLDIVSQSLLNITTTAQTIVYTWTNGEDLVWLFDKSIKSTVIIFNADSENQLLSGYFSAKSNSYYFGNLKCLQIIKKTAIYDVHQCNELLERTFEKYGKT